MNSTRYVDRRKELIIEHLRYTVALSDDDLNQTDIAVLEVLEEGRATPELVRIKLERSDREVSRQYINRRLKRLREHGHVNNVENTGVYELIEDPRDE